MLNGSNCPVKLGFGWSLGIRHPSPINKQRGELRSVSSDLSGTFPFPKSISGHCQTSSPEALIKLGTRELQK